MNKLKETRRAAGLTQEQLAEKAGVSYSLVRKYERGEKDIRRAKFSTVDGLCKALRCQPADILPEDAEVVEIMQCIAERVHGALNDLAENYPTLNHDESAQ